MVDIPETKFSQFVRALNTEVMAMNAMGWYDYDGNFHESSYSNPMLNSGLKIYSSLQYNMMYDEKSKIKALYTIPKK